MKRTKLVGVYAILVLIILGIGSTIHWAIFPNESPEWTGFGSYLIIEKLVREKKLWDWLDLLLVPLFLAFGAWYLSRSEKRADRRREADRFEHDNLSKYLELMTQLLIKEKIKDNNKAEVRSVGRTQTLRIIQVVSRQKKGQILQFLFESGLINKNPIINLNGGNFNDSNLESITLIGAELRGVYFKNCSFQGAHLNSANFAGSNLSGSDMSGAFVNNTNFNFADFTSATIKNTDLTKCILIDADFTNADLSGSVATSEQLKERTMEKAKEKPKVKV